MWTCIAKKAFENTWHHTQAWLQFLCVPGGLNHQKPRVSHLNGTKTNAWLDILYSAVFKCRNAHTHTEIIDKTCFFKVAPHQLNCYTYMWVCCRSLMSGTQHSCSHSDVLFHVTVSFHISVSATSGITAVPLLGFWGLPETCLSNNATIWRSMQSRSGWCLGIGNPGGDLPCFHNSYFLRGT